MSETRVVEARAVIEEIVQALGDEVVPETRAWWQYHFVVTELGDAAVRQLVREVFDVEAAGGMTTQDGSRRRTKGGVFFVLAYERLGTKRARSVRWRADRRFHEGMLQRFLRLLALVPSVPSTAAPAVEPPPPARETPKAKTKAPAPTKVAPAAPVKPAAAPAKPRRQAPPAVEVLVVRRGAAKPAS